MFAKNSHFISLPKILYYLCVSVCLFSTAFLLTTAYQIPPTVYAADCTTPAPQGGADNYDLFARGNISEDCSYVPIDAGDDRFQQFIDKKNSLIVGIARIKHEQFHQLFEDRDNLFIWDAEKMDSHVQNQFETNGEIFPNTCVPFEVFTDDNFNLSDYINTSYTGESKRQPALSRCLANGIEVNDEESWMECYRTLGHTLPNGDPNIIDGNPMDKATTPEQQYEEAKFWCDKMVKPCHNRNGENLIVDNGLKTYQMCPQESPFRRGGVATSFTHCQLMPETYEGWKGLPQGTKTKYLSSIYDTKAIGTVIAFIVWDQDESDTDAWRDREVKQGQLYNIVKFNVCGAQQTTNNMLDRIGIYTTPKQQALAMTQMKAFVNGGSAYPNIPDDWEVKYDPPSGGFQQAINIIIDHINNRALGPENIEDLSSQFMTGMTESDKEGNGILRWIMSDSKPGSFSFTTDGEDTEQFYKGWYIMSKSLAYQYAILKHSDYNQLKRYQTKDFSTREGQGSLMPLPGFDESGPNDKPINVRTECHYEPGPNNTQVQVCEEVDIDSRTVVQGGGKRNFFYGGGPVQMALYQRAKWLLWPEKQAQTDCWHSGVVEPVPHLISIIKSLFTGEYENLAGATKCPEPYENTLVASIEDIDAGVCTDAAYTQANIDQAINQAANKWGSLFFIGSGQLAQMMKEIYAIEGKIAIDAGEACPRNSVTATGPFQIKDETYEIVTNACSEEFMQTGLDQCDNDILNRCDPYDAAELAIRTILFSGGAWRYGDGLNCGGSPQERSASITNYDDLYRAVCNFGTGAGVIMPNLGNKTYCDYIFEKMGWPTP